MTISRGYRLELTAEDVRTIHQVGDRYFWSEVLSTYEPGSHEIAATRAHDIAMAMEEDTEGGHMLFPMLAQDCELRHKLTAFLEEVWPEWEGARPR